MTAIALLRGQSGVASHVCWSAQLGLQPVLGSDAKSTLHHLATPVKIPKLPCVKMGKNHAAGLQAFVRNQQELSKGQLILSPCSTSAHMPFPGKNTLIWYKKYLL